MRVEARADGARWAAAGDVGAAAARVCPDRGGGAGRLDSGRAGNADTGAGPIPQNHPPARRSTPAESERREQPAAQTTPVPTPEAPRELRAASAPTDAESERKIGDMLRRANQSLNNVYYQGLSAARKELYDLAKASIKDGEQALKERNFLYAETLADKAAKLATELAGR